jgi:hypothetical protein
VGFVGMGASNSSGKLLNPHVAEKSIHEFTVKVSEARYIHTCIAETIKISNGKQTVDQSVCFVSFLLAANSFL